MIRAERRSPPRGAVDPLRGEFETRVAGELRRFDTRLSTVAAMEAACGDRGVVDVLNAIILHRRAADQIPLLAAALGRADPAPENPVEAAAGASVGEAEAFLLALIFALGFTVGPRAPGEPGGEAAAPLDRARAGANGGPSPSAR